MSKLTAAEKKWLKKVQVVLDECPSRRIAFYATGDCSIAAYNVEKYDAISDYQDRKWNAEFCTAVEACDASFNEKLTFKNPVESTSG